MYVSYHLFLFMISNSNCQNSSGIYGLLSKLSFKLNRISAVFYLSNCLLCSMFKLPDPDRSEAKSHC